MKQAQVILQTLVGLALLGVLAVGLVFVFRGMNESNQAGVVITAEGTGQPYPPPQATLPPPDITLPPQPAPIVILPGQTIVIPTLTPWPTLTPQPTPTRRPGPTATGIPLPTPVEDATGTILYVTNEGTASDFIPIHLGLSVDSDGRPIGLPVRVVGDLELDFTPLQLYPSPNNRYLALMRPLEPGGQPYVVNQLTREVKRFLESFAGGKFLGWHPNGYQFLFWPDGGGLLLIDVETYEITTLVPIQGIVQGAAISPDGLTIAYITDKWPDISSVFLWSVSSAGSDANALFEIGSSGYLYPGGWSPDGTRLVYYGTCDDISGMGLCLYDALGDTRQPLSLLFAGYAPAWSPDGRYLAATGITQGETPCSNEKNLSEFERESCRYIAHSIYILDTLTNEVRQLAVGIAPVWSPDGSMLAFLSNRSGISEIWTIQVDGTGLQQLTTDGLSKSPSLTWHWR
jgi:hypothetical protein